jgi:S-adenosyl methyltransferase
MMSDRKEEPPGFDTSVAHPARMFDYFLGGKNHFPADQAAADRLLEVVPQTRVGARENRAFLQRVVRHLAGEAGIRQFLDIGTGLPTQGNVHEIVREIVPHGRVVYVDNDPIVHVHANALLAGDNTASIIGDLREPTAILEHPTVRRYIDFDQPVAILLLAVLHFITGAADPRGDHRVLRRVRSAGARCGPALALAPQRRAPQRPRPLRRRRPQALKRGRSAAARPGLAPWFTGFTPSSVTSAAGAVRGRGRPGSTGGRARG